MLSFNATTNAVFQKNDLIPKYPEVPLFSPKLRGTVLKSDISALGCVSFQASEEAEHKACNGIR